MNQSAQLPVSRQMCNKYGVEKDSNVELVLKSGARISRGNCYQLSRFIFHSTYIYINSCIVYLKCDILDTWQSMWHYIPDTLDITQHTSHVTYSTPHNIPDMLHTQHTWQLMWHTQLMTQYTWHVTYSTHDSWCDTTYLMRNTQTTHHIWHVTYPTHDIPDMWQPLCDISVSCRCGTLQRSPWWSRSLCPLAAVCPVPWTQWSLGWSLTASDGTRWLSWIPLESTSGLLPATAKCSQNAVLGLVQNAFVIGSLLLIHRGGYSLFTVY